MKEIVITCYTDIEDTLYIKQYIENYLKNSFYKMDIGDIVVNEIN